MASDQDTSAPKAAPAAAPYWFWPLYWMVLWLGTLLIVGLCSK